MDLIPTEKMVNYLMKRRLRGAWPPPVTNLSGGRISGDRTSLNAEAVELKAKFEAMTYTALQAEYVAEKKKAEEEASRERAALEAKMYFNQPGAFADFRYWIHAEYWHFDEAIALLLERDPRSVKWEGVKAHTIISPFAAKYEKLRELAKRATSMGFTADRVSPAAAVEWARQIQHEIPAALSDAFGQAPTVAHSAIASQTRADDVYSIFEASEEIARQRGFDDDGRADIEDLLLTAAALRQMQIRNARTGDRIPLENGVTPHECFVHPKDVNEWADATGQDWRWQRLMPAELTPSAAATSSATLASTSHVHSTVPERENELTPIIRKAQEACDDPRSPAEVWNALRSLAEERVSPLRGYVDGEGIQYGAGQDFKYLTRKQLGDRLRRLFGKTTR